MNLIINNIILYPKNSNLDPKFIKFKKNKVNVITGYSQRGKSAIISIIDYCLGSRHSNIPIGLIRNVVDKFAIYITIGDENIFLARDSKESSLMYFYSIKSKGENTDFNSNKWIKNKQQYQANRETIIKYLGGKLGFKDISQNDDTFNSGFDAPSSFRDTAAFSFQPQNLIANPTTIFFKTDTFEHLQRLKILFPLVLGYKSFEILGAEREINRLEKILLDKENKYEDLKKRYENWQSDVFEYYSEAISLGLSDADINIESSTVNEILIELKRVVKSINNNEIVKKGSSILYSKKIQELEGKRTTLLSSLDDYKTELYKIERFDKSKNNYLTDTVNEINERLKPIDWFLKQKGTNKCPFCDSVSEKAIDELLSLKTYQEQNNKVLNNTKSFEFSFEKEKNELRRKIYQVEDFLKLIDRNLDILKKENSIQHKNYRQIFEFAGKIEHILESINKLSPSNLLVSDILQLRKTLNVEKGKLKKLNSKFDKEKALNDVSSCIGNYIKLLPIEDRNNKVVHLDPEKSASIKIEDVKTKDNTFLSKIGSGANHMCYHLSTLLGLHEYFLKLPLSLKTNFVPSFLILDQPSQVYFPEGFPDENDKINKSSNKVSLDIQSTKKIFETCSKFLERVNFKTQIIILEHAPQETWKGVKHMHLVEEWRGDRNLKDSNFNALIPSEWEEFNNY